MHPGSLVRRRSLVLNEQTGIWFTKHGVSLVNKSQFLMLSDTGFLEILSSHLGAGSCPLWVGAGSIKKAHVSLPELEAPTEYWDYFVSHTSVSPVSSLSRILKQEREGKREGETERIGQRLAWEVPGRRVPLSDMVFFFLVDFAYLFVQIYVTREEMARK